MALQGPSSSLIPRWKYHVFLSFRGEDTRKSFTDHLYAAFQRKGMIVFRDDEELQRGEVISQELLQAIQQSLSAIVVLSPNYASSTWCLDELHNILESKTVLGREAFPVFYGVDPSDVRNQSGSVAESFRKHEAKFSRDKKKVQRWRDALREVASLSGWDSKHCSEAKLVEDIVEKVWKKLQHKLPSYNDEVVGIDSRVKEMDSLLSIGSEDVRFIGIWGMGGIGKTTLARVIYEGICSQFENFCFLHNVGEVSKRSDGLVHLQRKLLSCLKISNLEIDDLYEGKKKIINLLCNKKALLVLDDVSGISQLENLAANKKWFGLGSRVIITTRDRHLLISHGVDEKYEMKILNANDSLRLLSQKAFKRDYPLDSYLEYSNTLVECAGGLPLALKVWGSFLCGRSLTDWEDALDDINQFPRSDILNRLRISYDGLEDAEKTLFLDIAFFFTGWCKDEVTQILKDCGLHRAIRINVLVEKSLVTCDGGILEMHDLLQDMGRNIVVQESPKDASRRSRLYYFEDINQVLRENKGTELIEGIILKSSEPREAHWDPEAFSKMCKLRVLIILCDLHLPLGLKCLSSSLKILEWKDYPLQDLPLGLQLDKLVHLKIHCSKIKRLWKGIQYFRELKSIDLSDSKDLIKTPNISGIPCLERLVLKGCENLVKLHQSVAQHKNLAILNLKGCINLKTLPKKLEMDGLKELILSGCSKVKKLPEFGESMECLSKLELRFCENLVCLPQSIHNLKSLGKLDLCGCSKLSCLPNNINENNPLEELDVRGTAIRESPLSFQDSKRRNKFSFRRCAGLMNNSRSLFLPTRKVLGFGRDPLMLPPLSDFSTLTELDLSYCNLSDGSVPDDLGRLSSLKELLLIGNNFVNLGARIANLSQLERLDIDSCPMLQTLPVLPSGLHWFFVQDCDQLEPILFDPQIIWKTLEANRWNLRRDLWFIIPGTEIPPWFDNQDYFPMDPHLTDFDYDEEYASFASIIVDIPDYCRSSEWWGFAVCLSLESNVKSTMDEPENIFVHWASKAPDTETNSPLRFSYYYQTYFTGHNLFIVIFASDHIMFKPHLMGDLNKVQFIFYAENRHKLGKLKLMNCGCRVICKENAQVWGRGKAASEVEITSISVDFDIQKQSRITQITDELEGDEATASDFVEPNLHPELQ